MPSCDSCSKYPSAPISLECCVAEAVRRALIFTGSRPCCARILFRSKRTPLSRLDRGTLFDALPPDIRKVVLDANERAKTASRARKGSK